MQISKRAQDIQESPIRKLKPYEDEAAKRGIKVYHLNIGQPDIKTPEKFLDVYRNYDEKVLAYGPSGGLDNYRENLSNYYKKLGIDLCKENIIITTAGSEAIIFALMVVCDHGDEIIIPEPFYTNYNGFSQMAGVSVIPIETKIENAYALPTDEQFKNVITQKTKAIVICNPNNPTGAVYSKEELDRVVNIAQENNLYIIADEVYREFVYDGLKHYSFLNFTDASENIIVVDSVSKRYSACGARVGCIISKNKEIMASVMKFAQARLCPPTVDQLAANAVIDLEQDYFDEVIHEYTKRRDIVYEELSKIDGVICKKPEGAFYIMAKLPIEDSEDFVVWLLKEFSVDNETVMFAPAGGFYATPDLGKNEIRIAYVLNEADLRRAMEILRKGLEAYKNR
ncbi:MAG TPA: pyridoxal phosphate-dependent aminotransferase [bacterium]|nr:pyridoxal phosphate-dependent aminotransferase [bacterium]